MKGVAYIGTILIIVLTICPTFGRKDEDHDEERHLPPFLRCPCLKELTAIAATLKNISDKEIGGLKAQVAALTNLTLSLVNAVNNLTNEIHRNNSTPNATKCPASATPSSKVVGSLCYSINTTNVTFQNANASCRSFGGNLTEPLFANRITFYNSIKQAFPCETNLIGPNGEIWIGLLQPASATPSTTPFAYLSNSSLTVSPTGIVFASPPTIPNVSNAAVLVSPGAPKWKFYNILSSPVVSKPYICQYKLV